MELKEVLQKLESLRNPKNVEGMMRFGIRPKTKLYGVPVPVLRKIAKEIGKNHDLALQLWDCRIHEARLLAGFIAEPKKVTQKQFAKWVKGFDSWDVCDQVCGNLFDKTRFAGYKSIVKLSIAKPEFIKRTAFVLMACLAVHDKKMKDKDFIKFFPLIKKESMDERNFVKKAVNWALRQIGKRNKNLHKKAVALAKEILEINSKSSQWIARNAIIGLESSAVLKRLK